MFLLFRVNFPGCHVIGGAGFELGLPLEKGEKEVIMEKHIYNHEWIWKIIEDHIGAFNTINQYEIAEEYYYYNRINISPREVRRIIRELRKEGKPILSTPHKPGGYHIPFTYREVIEWRERMKKKAIKELAIINPVLKACNEMFPQKVGQLEIFEKVG